MSYTIYGAEGYDRYYGHLQDLYSKSKLRERIALMKYPEEKYDMINKWAASITPGLIDCNVISSVDAQNIYLVFEDEEQATMFMLEWK